ncbi:MAG: hypothetical protein QOD13_3045 [Thermoleophilaceae bacterium]|jgi:hypothetical protein|nr:hypothetical protein [Thermoleophilaceae bacterium]
MLLRGGPAGEGSPAPTVRCPAAGRSRVGTESIPSRGPLGHNGPDAPETAPRFPAKGRVIPTTPRCEPSAAGRSTVNVSTFVNDHGGPGTGARCGRSRADKSRLGASPCGLRASSRTTVVVGAARHVAERGRGAPSPFAGRNPKDLAQGALRRDPQRSLRGGRPVLFPMPPTEPRPTPGPGRAAAQL